MQLTIHGQQKTFIPLATFRAQWNLPDHFEIAHFSPKDWTGLGSIEKAGKTLTGQRQRVIQAVPPVVTMEALVPQVERLTSFFHRDLEAINPEIGLREAEVEFAVAGFYDILQSVVTHLVRARYASREAPEQILASFDFGSIYQSWLDNSVTVFDTPYTYQVGDHTFDIRVVAYAYGRIGLQVQVEDRVLYVADPSLACPAASYMKNLCEGVAKALCEAFVQSLG